MSMPKIISHRGANVYTPQNTMPAFEMANALHADGFETDVHMTKDGVLVICHNYTIEATSNGNGEISEMTLEQLKEYDFGSYFAPRFKDTRIPTVDEFLEFTKTTNISVLNIELKSPRAAETDIVKKTIAAVKEHGLWDRLLISSFDPKLLVQAKQIDKTCKTGFLYSPDRSTSMQMFRRPVEFAKEIGADALHPHEVYINKNYVKNAHDAGVEVNVWTVDKVRSIERMIRHGVDGIITNCPDVVGGLVYKHTEE